MTQTLMGQTMSRIYNEANVKAWLTYIEWLSDIKEITVNRAVSDEYTVNSMGGNRTSIISGVPWPNCLEYGKWGIRPGLISYKGIPLALKLSVTHAYQYCKIMFPTVYNTRYMDVISFNNNISTPGRYLPSLSAEFLITHSRIRSIEITGKKLSAEEVFTTFITEKGSSTRLSIGVCSMTESLDKVRNDLEKKYKRYISLAQKGDKAKAMEKYYARYTKNRWPKVNKLLNDIIVNDKLTDGLAKEAVSCATGKDDSMAANHTPTH